MRQSTESSFADWEMSIADAIVFYLECAFTKTHVANGKPPKRGSPLPGERRVSVIISRPQIGVRADAD